MLVEVAAIVISLRSPRSLDQPLSDYGQLGKIKLT